MKKFEKEVSRYLDGDLNEADVLNLLRTAGEKKVAANSFASACAQHQLLKELIEEEEKLPIPISHSRKSARVGWSLAAAAALMISLIGFALWIGEQNSPGLAVVSQAVGARWINGSSVQTGRLVRVETMELASGLIRLDFEHGTTMSVEGPAKFEIRDAMNVFFESGVATFHVPDEAKGFTVDTADADVVDLGTAFGMSKKPDGQTHVAVFEGEVEVRGRLVREGEAVRTQLAGALESGPFETSAFEKTWPVTSGVLQTTGMMRFVSPGPGLVPGEYEDNENITVFLEQRKVQLTELVVVDLTDPGEYRKLRRREGPAVSKGAVVRSYLIQLDPVGLLEKYDADKPRVNGQITFDRPIVGLIASGRKLVQTDPIFGHPRGDYGNIPRGLEAPKRTSIEEATQLGKDVVILAADQRTLILNFAAGSAVDQLRVLVEANTPGDK